MLAVRRKQLHDERLRRTRRIYLLALWPRAKDPRGVMASRSQSGGAALQGQHGGRRNKSRTGEKGSPQEGNKSTITPAKVQLGVGREPTFYIGGGNGVALVEGPLSELGWKRITDKQNENFKMKWVECKNTINYNAFKEGDQLVNHIPNCNLLTNKMGLLDSLQAYERLNVATKRRETRIKLNDFVPETFKLDDPKERELFLDSFKDDDIWICKPTGMNQGKGIYLVRDLEEFRTTLQERDERQNSRRIHRANMGRIIQRYITHPLLLDNKKFDIRAYMLISSTRPYLVLYHKGYVRLSLVDYDLKVDDLTAHLTNQYIQKKDPSYKEDKESTAWSMDKFNDYINEQVAPDKGLEQDWVYNTLTTKMKQIMGYCFHAVKNKLHCKVGYFDLYGLDFMIDEEMKVYLIEVNVNPSLATNCEALKEVIPGVVRETLYLTLECYEKSRRGQPLMPLHSLQNFDILYNGCTKSRDRASTAAVGPTTRSSAHSPVRRQRSPAKDSHIRSSMRVSQSLSEPKTRAKPIGLTPKATMQRLNSNPAGRSAGPRGGVSLPPLVSADKSSVSNSVTVQKAEETNEQLKQEGVSSEDIQEQSEGLPVTDDPTEGPQGTPTKVGEDNSTKTELKSSSKTGVNGDNSKTDSSISITAKPKVLVNKSRTTAARGGKRRVLSPDRGN